MLKASGRALEGSSQAALMCLKNLLFLSTVSTPPCTWTPEKWDLSSLLSPQPCLENVRMDLLLRAACSSLREGSPLEVGVLLLDQGTGWRFLHQKCRSKRLDGFWAVFPGTP